MILINHISVKKLITCIFAVALFATANISALAIEYDEAPKSGMCGESAKWSFNESTGVLTISGTGDMYTSYTPVDKWGYYLFRNEIEEVVVEEGVTSIAAYAFGQREYSQPSAYPNLTKLTLPSSVKIIREGAFGKAGLTSIKFSEGLETIEKEVFNGSSLSGNLVLPKTLNTIGQSAFSNTGITSVNLHEGMTMGGQAFCGCNSLKEVTIPKDLFYSGTGAANAVRANAAFMNCKGLEKVVILGGGIVYIDLTSEYPKNGLSQDMFVDCTSLKEVIIKADNIEYVEKTTSNAAGNQESGTFDADNNITFYIYKGSTTEATLRDAGYLTDSNVVYIANKTVLEGVVKSAEDMGTSLYTDESVRSLNKAVKDGKDLILDENATQDDIDNAVKAIEDAISGLTHKPADYTAVDEAIAKVPADLSVYSDETVAAVTAAVESVDRTKNITEQEIVDGYAKVIEDVVAALKLKPLGSISVTITVPGVDTGVTVTVVNTDGEIIDEEMITDGKCTVSDLEDGEYTIIVTAENCVPRSYDVTVADGDATLDAEINLYGDINGDGQITTADVGLANAHARGTSMLKGYDFDVADVTSDGEVTTADVGAINSHAQSVRALW